MSCDFLYNYLPHFILTVYTRKKHGMSVTLYHLMLDTSNSTLHDKPCGFLKQVPLSLTKNTGEPLFNTTLQTKPISLKRQVVLGHRLLQRGLFPKQGVLSSGVQMHCMNVKSSQEDTEANIL